MGMKEQIFPNGSGILQYASPPRDRVVDEANGSPTHRPPSPPRVVDVEIDELILDGFGPMDSRPANSRRPNSHRPYSARAAEAFRRELARELAVAGPAAEQLAGAIADAVFRQLAAERGGAR